MIPTRAVRRSILSSSRSFIAISSCVKVANCTHHFVELRPGQLREHRERDDFPRRALGLRERPFLVSEVREARLEMERKRVIHGAADLPGAQVLLQLVAALGANRV